MGNFACRMHLLINLDPAASKALRVLDDTVADEPGTLRLARTAAALLTRRGSAVAGIPDLWESFLRGKKQKNYFVTYIGHRMNISYYECAALYFHWDDLAEFIGGIPDSNQLISSVQFDIKEVLYKAGARSMGIMYALMMEPFERSLKIPGNILDLNDDLEQMEACLKEWTSDGNPAVGKMCMFKTVAVTENELLNKLFEEVTSAEEAIITQLGIELISSECLIVVQRQASTQLPGGKYYNPNEKMKKIAKTVPKMNNDGECDMSILDNILRAKPGMGSANLETHVMWWKNKPSQYLQNMSEEEREQTLNDAQKKCPSFIEHIKKKKIELQNKIDDKLKTRQQKKADTEATYQNTKLKLSRDVAKLGGPWCSQEVDSKLNGLNSEKQKAAVLTQLKYYKTVLCAKGDRELFNESKKGKKHSLDQLKENLKHVLSLNDNISDDEANTEAPNLVYRSLDERSERIQNRRQEMLFKLKSSEINLKILQTKSRMQQFIANPDDLVGKSVFHKCFEKEK
ncbi:uncharacterized protein LOC117111115 [Anneissia japonica]|uniref:uncharacterized protein LOC117111115 n=1 Tax=Anneissia japonica TaxID=1529436 RepID=UPI001425722A|nr:uncharacterized protein LOC117111115 [Anneissia japonica]